jgi:protein subunit release factor B
MKREKVLTIYKKDFEVKCTTGSGKGGQHQNKTATKVMIKHIPSGAISTCNSERSQLQNKKTALKLLTLKPKFRQWLYNEINKVDIEERIERAMHPDNIKVEYGEIKRGVFTAATP